MSTRLWLALLLIAGLLAAVPAPAAPAAAAEPAPPPAVPGRYIVGLRPGPEGADAAGPRREISTLLAPSGGQIRPIGGGAYTVELPLAADLNAAVAQLIDPRVRYVEPDYMLSLVDPVDGMQAMQVNDPAWPSQPELRLIEADRAWSVTTGSGDLTIAVLDTGVLADHVDLDGRTLPGYDFLANKEGAEDDHGHGTFTAALAAGAGNNKAGMAGLCWSCKILPLKILDKEGRGPASAFSAAIRYAVDHGARVINVSAGGAGRSQAMDEAVNYAWTKNILVIAAAGNTPSDTPQFPAAYERVLAVAASGQDDQVTPFSTYGPFVDLAAPGVNITSAFRASKTSLVRASGTSASAPIVTGVAALLLSLRPELPPQALSDLLVDTTIDIGPPGRDDHFGAGRLAAFDAVLAALRPGPNGNAKLAVEPMGGPGNFRLSGTGYAPGEPLRAWLAAPGGRTIVERGLAADDSGAVAGELHLGTAMHLGAYQLTVMGDHSTRVALAAVSDPHAAARTFFQPVPAPAPGGDQLYFPETQHTLSGGFRAYWEANGGVAIFGFPISEEFEEVNASDGRVYTVQYFERNRFEYHPEHAGTPYVIQLGLLGTSLSAGRTFVLAAPPTTPGVSFFPETQHTLGGAFRQYWEANGGLPIFGFPISEPFLEDGRLTQYFERNRFELHPDNPPEHQVLLGRLGVDLARQHGYLLDQ